MFVTQGWRMVNVLTRIVVPKIEDNPSAWAHRDCELRGIVMQRTACRLEGPVDDLEPDWQAGEEMIEATIVTVECNEHDIELKGWT